MIAFRVNVIKSEHMFLKSSAKKFITTLIFVSICKVALSENVTEQNLDLKEHPKSIQHPLIDSLFAKFDGLQYHLKSKVN